MTVRNRVRAFAGPNGHLAAEKVGHFLKALAGNAASKQWCMSNGTALVKATNESGDSVGGFLVPQELDDEIIAIRDVVGAFRRADIRPARSDNKVRPRRVGGLAANFVQEGSSIPESSLQFDAVETTLRKLAILARSSTEFWEDSAPDLGRFLTAEIAYAFAAKEDDCGFNGDGTSAYYGITGLGNKLVGMKGSIAAASGVHTFNTITTTDLGNLIAGVLAVAVPGAAWYVNQVGFAQAFCRLAGSGGGGYMETRIIDGVPTPCYLGFPVRFSAKLPDGSSSMAGNPMLFFGDLRMSSTIVEHSRGLVLATNFERAMDVDQVLLRGIQREDLINHSVGTASTLGPVAMLTGTA